MNFENINQSREQFGKENELRAEERNKYRTLEQKLLFQEKATGTDMAIEEAMKMDEEAEKMIASGEAASFTEAIEKLNNKEEFALKGQELVKKEEYARAQTLRIAKKIEEGDIEKARDIFTGNFFGKNYDEETQILIEGSVIPFIKETVIKDITNKDGQGLVKMIDRLSDYVRNGDEPVEFIKPADLEQIPEDILKSPEIIGSIKTFLFSECEKKLHPNHSGIFVYQMERFSKLGFFSEEEIMKSPEVKEIARKKIVQSIKEGPQPGLIVDKIPSFDELRKTIWKLGILSLDEIKQIEKETK